MTQDPSNKDKNNEAARRRAALVAKVRRLNFKISQIEKIVNHMDQNSATATPVQVQKWVKAFRKEIGRLDSPSTDQQVVE